MVHNERARAWDLVDRDTHHPTHILNPPTSSYEHLYNDFGEPRENLESLVLSLENTTSYESSIENRSLPRNSG